MIFWAHLSDRFTIFTGFPVAVLTALGLFCGCDRAEIIMKQTVNVSGSGVKWQTYSSEGPSFPRIPLLSERGAESFKSACECESM